MKLGTANHLKTKRLKMRLGVPLYAAIGILEGLWNLAVECANDGYLGRFTDEEIAAYLEYDGDASDLIEALVSCRWLDKCGMDEHLMIHDWFDHAPKFILDRLRKKEKPIRSANDVIEQLVENSTGSGKIPDDSTDSVESSEAVPQESPETAESSDETPRVREACHGMSIHGMSGQGKSKTSASAEVCDEVCETSPPAVPAEPAVMEFPTTGKPAKPWGLTQAKLDEYREAYPTIDVEGELRKARQFVRDAPKKRKTHGGMPRFLTAWLNRCVDRGSSQIRAGPSDRGPSRGADLKLSELL